MAVNTKNEQTKAEKNLNVIFTSPVFTNALKAPAFQVIIEKQLNILNFLEKTNKTDKPRAVEFVEKYNTATNKKFAIDDTIKYTDLGEMIDDINYLGVYVKNIYKIDLEALADGKEAKIIAPTTSEVQQPSPKGSNPMNMMMGGEQNNNFFAMQKANLRMQSEIKSGKIYLFKTKPKAVPWARLGLSAVFLFAFLSSLFLGIALIVIDNSKNVNSKVLYDDPNTQNYYLWDGILFIVFSVSLALYAVWTGMPLFKKFFQNKTNDNEIYYLSWQPLMILVFFIVFVIITSTGPGGIFRVWTSLHHKAIMAAALNSAGKFGVWTWYISLILLTIFIGLGVILGAVGVILNPKQDLDRLQAIQKQYIQEATDQNNTPAAPVTPAA